MTCTFRKIVSKDKVERKLPSSSCKLDKHSTFTLEKLLDVRSLGQYHDVIGKGKNSVLIATGQTDIKHSMQVYCVSFYNAVKIYKLSNDESYNKAIYKRTEREFEHMNIIRWVRFLYIMPYPVSYEKNIIVMSMIGTHKEPALPLSSIPDNLCKEIYYKIVDHMKYFFERQFVHGKFCVKNILIWRGMPHYVGWSHSAGIKEPSALKKLMKDCYFVTKFFKSKKVPVMPTEALFKEVSGFKDISPEVLDVIHNKEPRKFKCCGNPNRIMESNTPSRNCRFK